jgi:hypothetical protein
LGKAERKIQTGGLFCKQSGPVGRDS